MAAAIIELLRGGKAQREIAYSQLVALSRGEDTLVSELISTASVRVTGDMSGLNEARMANKFGPLGTMLAATLAASDENAQWALLTFADAAESQRALDRAAALEAGLPVTRADAAQLRALGETTTSDHHHQVRTSIAVACTLPILENVLAADASVVDAVEYQRATLTLHALFLVEPRHMSVQFLRDLHFDIPWRASGNAYNAVFKKEQSELTRDDALTLACDCGLWATVHCAWMTQCLAMAGVEFQDSVDRVMTNRLVAPVASDDTLDKLGSLFFDIVRDPQGASDLVLTGAWFSLVWLLGGTATNSGARTQTLIEAGLIETAVAELRRTSPETWLSFRTASGLNAGAIFTFGWTLSTLVFPSINIASALLDCGFIEVGLTALKCFEANGKAGVSETNAMTIWGVPIMLSKLDLTAPEAMPIVRLLQNIPSTVRFVLEHPVIHVAQIGCVSSAHMSAVCALAFGKDEEGGGFAFSQEQVDDTVCNTLSVFSGTASQWTPQLEPFFLRSVLHLAISGMPFSCASCLFT